MMICQAVKYLHNRSSSFFAHKEKGEIDQIIMVCMNGHELPLKIKINGIINVCQSSRLALVAFAIEM